MNDRSDAVELLELRLNHFFADRLLLERALTHASVHGTKGTLRDNEVLEFIGDRVIGLFAAERLAELYPQATEGELSVRLHSLVSRGACARVAREMGLGSALRLAGGETRSGGRNKDSILSDACEAIMAAVYYDAGLEAARTVFLNLWQAEFDASDKNSLKDTKTALQIWALAQGKPLPAYSVVARKGPDHAPTFTVEVAVQGLDPARADGRSRQEAEMSAAGELLSREGQL